MYRKLEARATEKSDSYFSNGGCGLVPDRGQETA